MNHIKIAISGKKNSGKDTVAKMIGELLAPGSYKQFAFADPIKEIIKIMYPRTATEEILWGPSKNRETEIVFNTDGEGTSCRQISLDIGKEGRKYNKDTWADVTLFRINDFLKNSEVSPSVVIVSDCRFLNEFISLKENNFIICRVLRPSSKKMDLVEDVSETDLDGVSNSEFHFVIENDQDLDKLQSEVNSFYKYIYSYRNKIALRWK